MSRSSPYPLDTQTGELGGVQSTEKMLPVSNQPAQLIWLTGFQSETESESKTEYLGLCSLTLKNLERHKELFGTTHRITGRLFVSHASRSKMELPEGFGIPLLSNEPLLVGSQFRVDTVVPGATATLSSKLRFVFNRGLERPLRPLLCVQAFGLVSTDGKTRSYNLEPPGPLTDADQPEPATDAQFTDTFSQGFTTVWTLPQGTTKFDTNVDQLLVLERDLKLHYAVGHLTRFGKLLELKDTTDDRVIFKLGVTKSDKDGYVQQLESFTSDDGVLLRADHNYVLTVVHENPTDSEVVASAFVDLYLEDAEFKMENLPPRH